MLQLKDLTPVLVAKYERWLKSTHISMNTISCYMRSLRALYNQAVEEKRVTDLQPFKSGFTGYPKTDKRSIGVDEIRKLQDVRLSPGSPLQLVRDIFLFCIFACGIPFVDVAFLRKSQISDDGYLVYQRRKTNQQIRLQLPSCAMAIVRRYQSNATDYVFPLLSSSAPEEAYRQYRIQLRSYNRKLKVLGKLAGISHTLTSYVSRHSWASLAYEHNTDVSVISKGLGHTSSRTTYVYIKGINDKRLDEANRKIVRKITGEKIRNSV
jgi:integrase